MNGPKVRLGVGVFFAGLHIGIAILWSLFPVFFIHIGMPVVFVQSSLLGMWAMLGRGPYWVRLPISFLLLLWIEHNCLLSMIITASNRSEAIVSTSIMIWGQFICIVGLIILLQVFMKLMRMESLLDSSTRFSLGNLLVAVTFIAVTIGFGRFMIQQLGLTMQVFTTTDRQFWLPPFLGVFNALVVVVMLPSLWVHRWRTKLVLFIPSLIFVGLISGIEDQIFRYFFYDAHPWYTFPGICLAQSIVFYITIFPLWRWKTMSEAGTPVIEADALALDGIEE